MEHSEVAQVLAGFATGGLLAIGLALTVGRVLMDRCWARQDKRWERQERDER